MSNEELAAAIRAGEQGKITELWAQVRRRYYRGQTVAEIATATGVPEKEVRKLEAAALRVLRHPRVSQVLREYR